MAVEQKSKDLRNIPENPVTMWEAAGREEVKNNSKCPRLESYMDGSAINMGEEMAEGLRVKNQCR